MKKKASDIKFKLNKEVVYRDTEGRILILRPEDNNLLTLNKSAKFIWFGLIDKKPLSQLIKNLENKFHISQERARRDILRFIKELENKKIVFKEKNKCAS